MSLFDAILLSARLFLLLLLISGSKLFVDFETTWLFKELIEPLFYFLLLCAEYSFMVDILLFYFSLFGEGAKLISAA